LGFLPCPVVQQKKKGNNLGDIPNSTNDVTIYDPTGSNAVNVRTTGAVNELSVNDTELLNAFTSPTAAVAPDLWQYYAMLGQNFQAVTTYITISGQAETDFLLFRNPANSEKTVRFHDLDYTYNKGAGIAVVRQYLTPTITNVGAALAITKKYVGFATNPVVLVYTIPTISVKGTLVKSFGQSSVGTYQDEKHLGYVIPAGYDLLFTVQPAANNTDHSLFLDWSEI